MFQYRKCTKQRGMRLPLAERGDLVRSEHAGQTSFPVARLRWTLSFRRRHAAHTPGRFIVLAL